MQLFARKKELFALVLGVSAHLANQDALAEDGQVPPTWRISARLSVHQVVDGVWVHTSRQKLKNGRKFPANGILVRNDNQLILVDTPWGVEATEELLDWVRRQLRLPVTKAIITPFHADSMGGASVLASRRIPFLSSALTRTLGEDEGVPLPTALNGLSIGQAVQFENVEVFYPGPGHSKDNLVVWVPATRVLLESCAIRSPRFPGEGNTADADLAHWPVAIEHILKQYPNARLVVPGHGPVGDASLLKHTRQLFPE